MSVLLRTREDGSRCRPEDENTIWDAWCGSATCAFRYVKGRRSQLATCMSSFVLALGWEESVIITLLVGSIVISGLGATWVPQTLSQ